MSKIVFEQIQLMVVDLKNTSQESKVSILLSIDISPGLRLPTPPT
jgi:hypothetical protein